MEDIIEDRDLDLGSSQCLIKNKILSPNPEQINIIREYYKLRFLPALSDEQANHLGEIYQLCSQDDVINFYITEIDHSLGHKLGLLNKDCRFYYGNQQSLLREYLGIGVLCNRSNHGIATAKY